MANLGCAGPGATPFKLEKFWISETLGAQSFQREIMDPTQYLEMCFATTAQTMTHKNSRPFGMSNKEEKKLIIFFIVIDMKSPDTTLHFTMDLTCFGFEGVQI